MHWFGMISTVSWCMPHHRSADSGKGPGGYKNFSWGPGSQPDLLSSASLSWDLATHYFQHVTGGFKRAGQAVKWRMLTPTTEGRQSALKVACRDMGHPGACWGPQIWWREGRGRTPLRLPSIPHVWNQLNETPISGQMLLPCSYITEAHLSCNLSQRIGLNLWQREQSLGLDSLGSNLALFWVLVASSCHICKMKITIVPTSQIFGKD